MRKLLYSIFGLLLVAVASSVTACGDRASAHYSAEGKTAKVEDIDRVIALLNEEPAEHWLDHLDSMPDDDCVKLRVAPPPGNLRKWFRDSNYLHFASGEQLGIKPIHSADDLWEISKPLVHIRSCEKYFVDSLSHSYPFLVPEAAQLLSDIGQAFNDSLRSRGGGCYRLKVTSLLRTDKSIRRLRRVNRMAVDSSAHRFGTTFDISYLKFICDAPTVNRTAEDLKNLLAEIVYNFHEQGRCLTIFERGQACFHITTLSKDYVRPRPPHRDDDKQ